MIFRFIIFIVCNFGALGVGSMFTSKGVSSSWYQNLNQAPWTPPGWVFGAAWTTIMVSFSFYMMYLWETSADKQQVIGLFCIQWLLNVSWNPVFFKYHAVFPALIVITLLTFLVGYFLFGFYVDLKSKSFYILPYLVWLLIATSLNGFIYFKN